MQTLVEFLCLIALTAAIFTPLACIMLRNVRPEEDDELAADDKAIGKDINAWRCGK